MYKKILINILVISALIVGLSYYFHNNSQASTDSEDSPKKVLTIKKKQSIIKTNLTNYLKTVTKDGTASVSFYNLGNDGSSNNQYAKVHQKGALEVESNATAVMTAASTYKLYLTAFLMHQKQNGDFSWTSENETGFTKMIVNSENDFAEEQILNNGADTISSFIASQGWYPKVFQTDEAAQTTSYSLQLLLESLEAGTGVFQDPFDQSMILNLMGKQIYRSGIPAGAAAAETGTTVQDKVGFLEDTNNDAGIVTLPNGQKYILVIMTNGHNQSGLSGFSRIAKITKNVQKIVYGSHAGEKLVNYS
ncbi:MULTISPECIES: serine hydrolase [unclassified Companilactobacillus]|jgi:beta-lactamase class A|uniref:serine hydrolase n=1 Tax=unclassified Companilactobacillus TaxID=2767904 RepID=UPI002FEFC670